MGQTTIPAVVRDAAAKFGSAEALVDGPVRLGYDELLERVRTVARAFAAGGVGPGDRVAINLPNTHHWVLSALGALYAGATLIPVNTRFTAPETGDLLARGRVKALVGAADFLRDAHFELVGVLEDLAEDWRRAFPVVAVLASEDQHLDLRRSSGRGRRGRRLLRGDHRCRHANQEQKRKHSLFHGSNLRKGKRV